MLKAKMGKTAAAVLLAAAIITAGIAVPQLLLGAERKKLISNTGAVEAGELLPYISETDLADRIGKLSELASRCRTEGMGKFMDIREPLDMEYSQEAARTWAVKFGRSIAEQMDRLWAGMAMGTETYSTTAYDAMAESEVIESSTNVDFLVSPTDSVLSLWYIYAQSEEWPWNMHIMLDAVTGIPVFIAIDGVYDVDLEEYWKAVAGIYSGLYGSNFTFTAGDYTGSGMFDEQISDEYVDIIYYSGKSVSCTLELQANFRKDKTALLILNLFA